MPYFRLVSYGIGEDGTQSQGRKRRAFHDFLPSSPGVLARRPPCKTGAAPAPLALALHAAAAVAGNIRALSGDGLLKALLRLALWREVVFVMDALSCNLLL